MDTDYNVYCEFDIEKHKTHYVNYLEVMVAPDGAVHYAVPSHQEYAIRAACDKLGVSRKELNEMTPPEYYFDWLTWLLGQTGYMAVWNEFYECPEPTRKQAAALRKLKMAGLYRGPLPERKDRTIKRNEREGNRQ